MIANGERREEKSFTKPKRHMKWTVHTLNTPPTHVIKSNCAVCNLECLLSIGYGLFSACYRVIILTCHGLHSHIMCIIIYFSNVGKCWLNSFAVCLYEVNCAESK